MRLRWFPQFAYSWVQDPRPWKCPTWEDGVCMSYSSVTTRCDQNVLLFCHVHMRPKQTSKSTGCSTFYYHVKVMKFKIITTLKNCTIVDAVHEMCVQSLHVQTNKATASCIWIPLKGYTLDNYATSDRLYLIIIIIIIICVSACNTLDRKPVFSVKEG